MQPSAPDRYGDSGNGEQSRRDAAAALTGDLLRRWERGEATDDDDTVIASRPDLLPELVEELRNARLLRRAVVTARKAGPAEGEPEPLRILSDAEIEEPLNLTAPPGVEAPAEVGSARALPRVPGCALLGEVSVGGQAAVYRGVQESTGRTVAVKVIAGGSLSGSRQRARFDREAQILAALRHPHIVNILDRGRTADGAGDLYLLMEFVEGHDLDQWWDRELPPGEDGTRRLLELFAKLCRAVEEAHARGIVHRDLKPSNIRVDTRGEPRVLDFGLARPIEGSGINSGSAGRSRVMTVSGQLLGSIPWASPEQAAGDSDRLDARSDVYSLGVMLYQALAGRFPYPVDGPLHVVLDRIATFAPPAPSRLRGTRPVGRGQRAPLDAVVLKALAKSPGERYPSAGAMAEDVERLLAGRPISAASRPWWRRRPRAALAVAVFVLLLAGFAVQAWRVLRPPDAPTVFEMPSRTNSLGMRLVLIPGRSFTMGSSPDEPGRRTTDRPRHSATVGDFYIGTLEVTQQQYQRVMGGRLPPQAWRGDNLPVHGIRWADADEFCRRLSAAEGKPYRLPTEAEWEYACRAGSNAPFFGSRGADYVGWHYRNSGGEARRGGQKWANAWGLYDMHGNVAEWCADEVPQIVQAIRTATATQPATTFSHQSGILRVARGGSVLSPPEDCRAAARQEVSRDMPNRATGFRVVLDAAGR